MKWRKNLGGVIVVVAWDADDLNPHPSQNARRVRHPKAVERWKFLDGKGSASNGEMR